MGNLKKIGGEYFIEFYARGLKYQQKAGTDKAKAEALLKEIEEKLARGEAALIVRDVDIDIFFQDFLEYARDNYPAATHRRYESSAKHFLSFLPKEAASVVKLSQVMPRVIEQYKAYLMRASSCGGKIKTAPQVVNLTLYLLRNIFEYAIKLGYLNDNPTLHIRFLALNRKKPRVLTSEEKEILLSRSPRELACVIKLVLFTGLRIDEVVNLTWSDIDQEKRLIKIHGKKKFNSKIAAREIPLEQSAYTILQELEKERKDPPFVFSDRSGKKLEVVKLRERFAALIKELSLNETISFYTLRHTFAITLLEKRVPLAVLQKILGYEDIARVMIYHPFIVNELQ